MTGHKGVVLISIAYSPDGKKIASGSNDTAVRLWDAATGQPLGQPLGIPLNGKKGERLRKWPPPVARAPTGHAIV